MSFDLKPVEVSVMASPTVAAIPPVFPRVVANGFDTFAVIEEENRGFLVDLIGEPFYTLSEIARSASCFLTLVSMP